MYNWVGRYNFFLVLLSSFLIGSNSYASSLEVSPIILEDRTPDSSVDSDIEWNRYQQFMQNKTSQDYQKGLSYVISGSLALLGGLAGEHVTNDNLEKATYTIFQTIGIASIGYGAYTWQLGDEDRDIYMTLSRSKLSAAEKMHFLRVYRFQKKQTEQKERNIKAITHGLIAVLNIYNATQQKNDSLKNGLYFIGGINLLATISYTFEF